MEVSMSPIPLPYYRTNFTDVGPGSASIFINDDGYAFLDEKEREERVNFYHDNNIGWVARPKHNENGYVRRGKFKKASNMNFALNISSKVERLLRARVQRQLESEKTDHISTFEEETMYKTALAEVLAADPRATADGNIRIGEFILIVDSDTQVVNLFSCQQDSSGLTFVQPVDCLLYGAAEMFLSPEVAIVQHATGVMQVSWDYFENGITYFTNLIYTAVTFAVGSGETGTRSRVCHVIPSLINSKQRRLLGITVSFAGKLFSLLAEPIKRVRRLIMSHTGLKATSLRTSIWLSVCRSLEILFV
jgi:hypothetical protein